MSSVRWIEPRKWIQSLGFLQGWVGFIVRFWLITLGSEGFQVLFVHIWDWVWPFSGRTCSKFGFGQRTVVHYIYIWIRYNTLCVVVRLPQRLKSSLGHSFIKIAAYLNCTFFIFWLTVNFEFCWINGIKSFSKTKARIYTIYIFLCEKSAISGTCTLLLIALKG